MTHSMPLLLLLLFCCRGFFQFEGEELEGVPLGAALLALLLVGRPPPRPRSFYIYIFRSSSGCSAPTYARRCVICALDWFIFNEKGFTNQRVYIGKVSKQVPPCTGIIRVKSRWRRSAVTEPACKSAFSSCARRRDWQPSICDALKAEEPGARKTRGRGASALSG